jgi:endonuclease YncB( thermonuclease family)
LIYFHARKVHGHGVGIMIRKNRWYAYAIIMVVFIVCFCVAYYTYDRWNTVKIDPEIFYPVVYVADGDTFRVKIGHHIVTIRLLGINTPETVDPRKPPECYGPESSLATKKLLTGQDVRLELNPNREATDRYGRYLAYAYLETGILVNEYLLTEGFAREYTYGRPYSFQEHFRDIEKSSREKEKGLWGICQKDI